MELVRDLKDFKLRASTDFMEKTSIGKSAITIGKFDGIHKGHQKPINSILEKKKEGYATIVFTFDPPPAVFFGKSENRGLMTREEKRRVFEKLGIDYLVEYPLNSVTAAVSATDFVEDILIGKLSCGYLAAGTDVSFGDKGLGDSKLLLSYAEKGFFHAEIIDKVLYEGEEISSSRIKKKLLEGDMESVMALIGYPYCITGEVIHGAKLGSKLNMPTINVTPFKEKLLPPKGVYYSFVSVDGRHFNGISNVGSKPTVSDENIVGVETFLYDFSGDLYGKEVSVNLLHYKRPEMKFNSVDELKARMEDDISSGRAYHKEGRFI